MSRIIGNDRARLLSRTRGLDSGCLQFTGARGAHGYGNFYLAGRYTSAHRAAFLLFKGPIADGLDVDHECHNLDKECSGGTTCPHRLCINVDHLVLRARRQNLFRGRASSGINFRKTHCPRRHSYDAANTYVTKQGARVCRQCHREREAARRAGYAWPPDWPPKGSES